jgi:mycothiol synthase
MEETMNGLPAGYTVRSATTDDIDTIAVAINTYTTRLVGEALYPPQYIRGFLTTPGFDLANSCKLVFSPSNSVAGLALVMDIQTPHVQVMGWGVVPEAEQGNGIGSALHSWIEPRSREAIAKAPDDARVFLMQNLFDQDKPGKAFLNQYGYQQTRHFWRMVTALDDTPQPPTWPEGIVVRNVDLRENLEAPSRALDEAFSDHYGHVAGDFEQKLERQRHNLKNDSNYSPDLSFVAMDGDKIAAVCTCSPQSGVDTTTGYVNSLGVLRPWRKRGLGLALLHHAFGVFKQKGKIGAALHVDAQSLTGATRLYEKAGMQVDQLSHEYQLELRPGIDLATTG